METEKSLGKIHKYVRLRMLHKVQQQKVVWPDQQIQTFNPEGAEYQNMILNS